MKRFIIIVLSCITLNVFAIENSITDSVTHAQELYEKGDYNGAIQTYASIINAGYESSDIYYNYGNAYFKTKKLALAIVNYERALLHNPNNEDAQVNLEIARNQQVDKINSIPQFFLKEWAITVVNIFTSNTWTIISVLMLLLLLSTIYIFLYSSRMNIKQIAFSSAIVFAILCGVAMYSAHYQKDKLTNHKFAIVIAPSVTALSTPSQSGTSLFVIHEGLKIELLDEVAGYSEIKLPNGEEGWIPISDFEKI